MRDSIEQTKDRRLAYALLRVLLGVNIAVHGISRILAGASSFASETASQFAKTPLPHGVVYGYGVALPFVEAVVGLAVFLGLRTRWALSAGMLLMVSLTFGSALKQDWTAAGWQLLYGLVYFVLLSLREYDAYSLDGQLGH